MNPLLIAQLIAQYGIPFAQEIDRLVKANLPLTQADWDKLNALAAQTARTKMLSALQSAGIDPASAQGQALLALT